MFMKKLSKIMALIMAVSLATAISMIPGSYSFAEGVSDTGRWVSGDFHTHTFLTDGLRTEEEVLSNAFDKYNLDWMANSEHGGISEKNPFGADLTSPVWRWITLKDFSYPVVSYLRMKYPSRLIIQGVEWNVPTHEHASVGIISDNAAAISNFEYMFDANDSDTSRMAEGLPKCNTTHKNAVAGAKYLQDAFKNSSYFLMNHPSRKLKYSIADIRDFNNAAPDVCFGFEGLPGHQKESARGGYNSKLGDDTNKARTYGGADYMVAKVGGLWDALLGEGRNFWVFVNSDFHNNDNDFWPGEYAKSYTWINNNDYKSVIQGMRSGKSFAVHGDLINALDFKVKSGDRLAEMGQTLSVNRENSAQITIRFKSPAKNNNNDKVVVDHIDLIAGDVTGKAEPGTPEYKKDTNETTRVIATFTKDQWKADSDGWYSVTYEIDKINKSMYFRLRGTNLAKGVKNETDEVGNPLCDDLVGKNDESKAYKDLWFYSNPVFVNISK